MRSVHVSQVIPADPGDVYRFASVPQNLPLWAQGLAGSEVVTEGGLLVTDSPMGRVTVRFVGSNSLRVLDHDVTLADGTVVNNPMRVVTHPDGAEVIFTVRQLGGSDEEFEKDCSLVAADLLRLKARILAL